VLRNQTGQHREAFEQEHGVAILRPFPPRMCTTMRWLSMSVTFEWVNSAFRAPVP
jgi:hypothetical protein